MQQSQLISYGITAIVVVVVLSLRLRTAARTRPLKIGQLWIVPAIYGVIVGAAFIAAPPHSLTAWGLVLAGLLIGAALGWQRGRFMKIHVDAATGTLQQQASPAAIIFIVVLILLRSGLRAATAEMVGGAHLDPLILTDVLLALAFSLLSMQRVEMYLRAKILLAARSNVAVP